MESSVPSTETEVPVSTPEPSASEPTPETPAPKATKPKSAPKAEKSKPAKAKPAKAEKSAATKAPAKSAPAKKAAKSEPKKVTRAADGPTGAQIRVLKSLVKKALTGKEISDATGIHPTAIGNLTGYRNPEINSREVHKNNLLNRGFVRIMIAEEGSRGFRYEITAKGRDCLNKLK